MVVLSWSVVGLAAVDGTLAGRAGLRNRAVGAIGGPRGALLGFAWLSGWGSGGETDAHEEGGAKEGELHGVWCNGN